MCAPDWIRVLSLTGIRSAALWWVMSDSSSVEGGGLPEMLVKLRRGNQSSTPRWERFAMRLVVGHLLAYNVPGLDKVSLCLSMSRHMAEAVCCTLGS